MALKYNTEELDAGQLDLMFNMIRFGYQKVPHIGTLKSFCDQLRQGMIQTDSGMRENSPKHYVRYDEIGTIINCIVVETMCLYLSGALDKLEEIYDKNGISANDGQIKNGGLTDG